MGVPHSTTDTRPSAVGQAPFGRLSPPASLWVFGSRTAGFRRRAFTLLEVMIVVGIMGICLTMGVPIVYKAFHKVPFDKAIADVVEVCSNARAQAILQGHEMDVVFYPDDGRVQVSGAAVAPPPDSAGSEPVDVSAPPPAQKGSGWGTVIPLDSVTIEMLDVNLTEYKDQKFARVRFFPNGMCDELTLVMLSDRGQRVGIQTEITTGLANVEYDVRKLK